MGLIDEILRGFYAEAMRPVFEHIQEQGRQMQEECQRVAQAQTIMKIAYENQELRKRFDEELEENVRCWFKRVML